MCNTIHVRVLNPALVFCAQLTNAVIKLAQEAPAAAPSGEEDYSLLLIGGGGFSLLVPLIVVTFVVFGRGVFNK